MRGMLLNRASRTSRRVGICGQESARGCASKPDHRFECLTAAQRYAHADAPGSVPDPGPDRDVVGLVPGALSSSLTLENLREATYPAPASAPTPMPTRPVASGLMVPLVVVIGA